ncbi:MAG TPA: hypothetical protein VFF33_02920 [Ignavibacteriaceae bacterium]|nr:hypothetical protein [Ignavibacteriaceae bacterium]
MYSISINNISSYLSRCKNATLRNIQIILSEKPTPEWIKKFMEIWSNPREITVLHAYNMAIENNYIKLDCIPEELVEKNLLIFKIVTSLTNNKLNEEEKLSRTSEIIRKYLL